MPASTTFAASTNKGSLLQTMKLWQAKLLNLGKKNSLLFFNLGNRSSVRFNNEKIDQLIENLTEHEMEIVSGTANEDVCRADCDGPELRRRLAALRKRDREWEDEQGVNVLFLVLGFIKWLDNDGGSGLAPLLMVPCDLLQEGVESSFFLCREEDSIVLNETLNHKLRQSNITLPTYQDEAPSEYFLRCSAALPSGWQVRSDIVLSTFAFSKLSMWSDMQTILNNGVQNQLIRCLADDRAEIRPISTPHTWKASIGPYMDRLFSFSERSSLLNADYSQVKAMVLARQGHNLVIHGPPGTGKSQTIVNIICSLLEHGKSVLFVSEKAAALDVVKRRLENCQLGLFCLDLHSDRGKKDAVYEQLLQSLVSEFSIPHSDWGKAVSDCDELCEKLNKRIEILHAENRLGMSNHDLIQELIRLSPARSIKLGNNECNRISQLDSYSFRSLIGAAKTLSTYPQQCNSKVSNWSFLRENVAPFKVMTELPWLIFRMRKTIDDITPCSKSMTELFELHSDLESLAQVESFTSNLAILKSMPEFFWNSTVLEIDKRLIELDAVERDISAGQPIYGSLLSVRTESNNENSTEQGCAPEIRQSIDYIALLTDWMLSGSAVLDLDCLRKTHIVFEHLASVEIDHNSQGLDSYAFSELKTLAKNAKYSIQLIFTFVERLRAVNGNFEEFFSLPGDLREHVLTLHNICKRGLPRTCFKTREQAIHAQSLIRETSRLSELRTFQERPLKLLVDVERLLILDNTKLRERLSSFHRKDRKHVYQLLKQYQLVPLKDKGEQAQLLQKLKDFLDTDDQWSACVTRLEELLEEKLVGTSTDWTKLYQQLQKEYEDWSSYSATIPPEIVFDSKALQIFKSVAPPLLHELHQVQKTLSTVAILGKGILKSEPISNRMVFLQTSIEKVTPPVISEQRTKLLLLKDWFANLSESQKILVCTLPLLFHEKSLVLAQIERLNVLVTELQVQLIHLSEFFEDLKVIGSKWSAAGLSMVLRFIQNLSEDEIRPSVWLEYCQTKKRIENGLGADIVQNLVEQNISLKDFPDALKKSVLEVFLLHLSRENTDLTRPSQHYRTLRQQFIDLDKKHIPTKYLHHLVKKLAASYPSEYCVTARIGEVGRLRSELEKKRKRIPFRSLLNRCPKIIRKLKPCFMMSPLAISKFLPVEYQFDVVIFDEASQVFPEDAIGAIHRSAQVVVVGDTQQLPPTNFFKQSEHDSDESDDDEDTFSYSAAASSESILDAMKKMVGRGVYETHLQVHYRSKDPALISFSNKHFYGNRLEVYPSSILGNSPYGLRDVFVAGGIFDSGGTRTNENEARVVAELIFELLAKGETNIGVVALSKAQADLIEEKIRQHRQQDNQWEEFFSEERLEPFFVKNLENVQGDERDHIILSLGFGPNPHNGKVDNRFGPITKSGGERRLNVAISRAREQLTLVRSMNAEDISATSRGAQQLKAFLEFVRQNQKLIVRGSPSPSNSSHLVHCLEAALRRRGYNTIADKQILGRQIDLAIVSNDEPQRFLLGIQFDGESFFSNESGRDREWLHHHNLKAQGWDVHQVWCADWLRDSETEIRKILDVLASSKPEQSQRLHSHFSIVRTNERILSSDTAFLFAPYRKTRVTTASSFESAIRSIVAAEGPVHFSIMLERIRAIFAIGRVGSRQRADIDLAVEQLRRRGEIMVTMSEDECFLCIQGSPIIARRSVDDDQRAFKNIDPREIEAGLRLILSEVQSATEEELVREAARQFGFLRISAEIEQRLKKTIKGMTKKGALSMLTIDELVLLELTQ